MQNKQDLIDWPLLLSPEKNKKNVNPFHSKYTKKSLQFLIAFILFTFFFTIFGDKGLLKIYKLQKEIKRLASSTQTLKKENQKLTEDIKKMRYEKSFQERSARETLGMVKSDEIIYEFSD